ncbi:MAG: HAMP domain-containing protein [Anaerolineaceae bacterium]|nr:HAMP domain-containing protein [Anaerolineaceae bacterium]
MGENGKTVLPAASTPPRNQVFRLSGLQTKLIFPYVILTLLLASIGIFIITRLVVDSDRARFSNSVLNDSKIANDGIVQNEKAQLDKLRYLIFTAGMAQAIYDRNADQVKTLLEPNFTNTTSIDVMSAIDQDGKEILTYARELEDKNIFHEQKGGDFSRVAIVQKTLSGETDTQGDKFVEILQLEQGPILFTSAPVRDSADKIVGVMMVGTYLKNVLKEIKSRTLSDIIMVDLKNNLIASTFTGNEEGFNQLLQLTPANTENTAKIQEVNLDQRPYLAAYSSLMIRQQQVGWIGVVRDSDYLVTQTGRSRELFILLFTFGTLAVIIIGYFLAQNLAKPLIKLRNLTQIVAAGDLSQSIQLKRSDEIGELGEAFDTMTLHLRERTEEAARLYAETLQRNRELAEINVRLESTQLQLIQSEKLASVGHLTAGIVHDVKNPFAVIMGMAEVLADDDTLDETMKHGLKTIRESAIKGNTIVSDLLKFSRQSQPEMRKLDLRDTVQTSIRMTAYLTRRFNLINVIPETPVMVTYDAQQIEQVMINMIHNAVQAMPNKGTLRITLAGGDNSAKITIQDTGYGIPHENLMRIFDPFFTTKPEGEGTGLGLSVSYGIIANHHGKIDVESEVGSGTTFTIVLPIDQPAPITGEYNP